MQFQPQDTSKLNSLIDLHLIEKPDRSTIEREFKRAIQSVLNGLPKYVISFEYQTDRIISEEIKNSINKISKTQTKQL